MKSPAARTCRPAIRQRGATIIEYTLIVVFLSIASVLTFGTVASALNSRTSEIATTIQQS